MSTNSNRIDFRNRFDLIAALVCIAFMVQMFISYRLWMPLNRQYPMIPIFEILPLQMGSVMDFLLFWGFILGGIATALFNWKKYTIPFLFLIYLIWILQDIMRVQAWAYHYLVLLGLLWYYQCKKHKQSEVLFLLRFVMIMTYIWTGFHKINLHFAEVVFPWLMGIFPVFEKLGDISVLGYTLAVFELLLGFGLMWKCSRKAAVLLISAFHLIILVFLIADGWNYVVYPWNLVMIVLVWLLFWEQKQTDAPKRVAVRKFWPSYLIFFLYGIAPGLQPFNLWPYDLCQMMYTGLSLEMRLGFDGTAVTEGRIKSCIPTTALRQINPIGNNQWTLSMDDWTMAEFNLPTYPAKWYYKKIGKSLCRCVVGDSGFIELLQKSRWKRQDELIKIPCKVLLK